MGMGLNWIESYPKAKEIFDRAENMLDKPISKIAFYGPESKLMKTINSQPAIFVLDCACWALWEDFSPAAVAGHSLGEFAALVAAGTLDFPKALGLVKIRAEMMEQNAQSFPGVMMAVIGADLGVVENIVGRKREKGTVVIANYNCPGQVVVSCEKRLSAELKEEFLKQNAKKVIELSVSGGFHSPLVSTAADSFRAYLESVEFNDAKVPLVSNVSGKGSRSAEEIKHNLGQQMDSPVKWEESIKWLADRGVDTFLELGPGKVLKGIGKKIVPQAEIRSMEDASLEELKKWLAERIR